MTARWPVVFAVILAAAGCGGGAEKSGSQALTASLASGGLIDVGGRHLYLECEGSGSPTVVLQAGWGSGSEAWSRVLSDLARTTRTCAYDRAGLGASDPIPGVHDAGDEVRDLERLLDRARIAPPYVVVGHSYGGLLARLFAVAHPQQTGGVVLVDAIGRDAWRRELAGWPKGFAPKARRAFAKRIDAGIDTVKSAALDNRIHSLGDVPLVVITAAQERAQWAGLGLDPPPELYRRGLRLWLTMQDELAGLSPDRVHVVASRSDHVVQNDQPLVVTQAVNAVVGAVRDHTRLPACDRVFTGPDVRCLS
jgi:pimeloyl-ACP methyl ester carboxylesterase